MALEVATRYELLPAHPRSAAVARDRVRGLLAAWGLADLAEAAELVTAELISNAVKVSEPDGQVGLGVYRSTAGVSAGVVVEVWDAERRPPRLLDAGPDDIGGRGLMLVGLLTREWGYRRPATGGKVVYAVVDAPM
ncbi:ATP-binding protein [Herbidospora sp. RD11066]